MWDGREQACGRRRSTPRSGTPSRRFPRPLRKSTRSSTSRPSSSARRSVPTWPGGWMSTGHRRAFGIWPDRRPRAGRLPAAASVRRICELGQSHGQACKAERQASIARGQEIFNTKPFLVEQCWRLQRPHRPQPYRSGRRSCPVNCGGDLFTIRHGFPHAGSELVLPPQRDVGVGGHAAAGRFNGAQAGSDTTGGTGPAPANDMPIFEITCNGRQRASVLRRRHHHERSRLGADHRQVHGYRQVDGPAAARAGVARALLPATAPPRISRASSIFYNQRFQFVTDRVTLAPPPLTVQEKADLVNFLSASSRAGAGSSQHRSLARAAPPCASRRPRSGRCTGPGPLFLGP